MAWGVDDIYNFSRILINKAQMQTYEPDALFYIWNAEQRAYYKDLAGRWQKNSNSKTGANTGLIENEVITEQLSRFIVTYNPVPSLSGFVQDPGDVIQFLAIRVNGFACKRINKNQIAWVNKSVIDGPSESENRYYYTRGGGQIQILPITVAAGVEMDILEDCPDVKWAFIPDPVTGLPVYDPGNSLQPNWKTGDIQEITKRTLSSLGVHFSSQDFQNFANRVVNTGNS